AVEVGDPHVDCAREFQEHVAAELPRTDTLEPAHVTLVVAELREREVELAVAVQIGGTDIGHAGGMLKHSVRREVLSTVILEDEHGADPVVVGKHLAHAGNQEVDVAITVHVRGLHANRHQHAAGYRRFAKHAALDLTYPLDGAVAGVTGDNVEQAILAEADGVHACDPWG